MEQNDFFYKRLKCTKNEYKKITSNLSEKELNLIKKINQNNESFGELQAQTLFIKLKNILLKERSKIEETIYIFFDGYPKEDVDAVIKDLNEYDKNILFLRYGKDLEHPVRSENWTEEHRNYFFNELIPRMKIKLETLHITPVKVKHVFKKLVPIDEQKNRIKSPKKEEKPNKGTSLYAMYPEIKKEDLKLIVYHLDSTKKRALYLRHSETLNSYKYLSLVDFRKIEAKYNEAIVLLDKIALEYKKTLKEQIQFDEKNLELLNQDEKKALEIIHGENYDKTLPTFVLNKTEKELYAKALKLLKNGLQQVKSPKEEIITDKHLKKELPKKTCQSVEEVQEKSCEKIKSPSKISSKKSKKETKLIQNKFPDKTLEEIREAVKKLTKKQQEAIYARHGQDLDTYNEWSKEETKKYFGNYRYAIKNLNSILYENKQTKEETKLIQDKFSDKTLEEIKEAVKKLAKKQQEAIYARHGKELDTYNKWNKEEAKKYTFNYHYAIKNLNSILYEKNQTLDIKVIPEIETRLNSAKPKKEKENSIKDASKKTYQYITEVPKSKNEVKQEENTSVIFEGKSEWINLSINDSGELIHFNINYNGILTKENKRTLEIMIETALKEALHKMKFSSERIKPNVLQEKFLDKATGEIKEEVEKSEKLFHSDQNEYVKDPKIPTVSKKKLNTKKKEQPILVSKAKKDPLKEEKQKLKVRLYDKYFPVYKDFITPKEMEIIIDESVNSYQIEEKINMEISSTFKIESAIYMLLSKKYCENIDNEIGLNISLFVEEFYGNKIKNKYANFSQGDISEALLKTLETYNGEKSFFIETILYLKKKSN